MTRSNIMITFLLLFFSSLLVAQANFSVEKVDMTIDGTSTLHDWTSTVKDVDIKGTVHLTNGTLASIDQFKVSIPVTSIESTKGSMMDNKTYNALKSEDHPKITYRLEKVNSIDKIQNGFKIRTQGKLTIAGTTNTIYMTVDGKALSNGKMEFEGAYTLNMTDYDVSPPTAMLGTIKTGEEVTIKFNMTLNVNDMSK